MTKRGAETSGEKDAERLAVCVICVTYTVDRPVPRCETHNRHPTYCIRALQSELAEAKRLSEQYLAASRDNLECYHRADKERDAALARVKELEYWRNGSLAMKALDKARDERDAALAERDHLAKWSVPKLAFDEARAEAESLRAEFEDLICHFQGACDCTHTNFMDTYKARLSPPAPAQVPFLGADWPGNKPAPEKALVPILYEVRRAFKSAPGDEPSDLAFWFNLL